MGIIGRAAGQSALDFEAGDALPREPGNDCFGFLHDLGANAIAREQEKIIAGHVSRPVW